MKGLEKEFGPILGKKAEATGETGASADILKAIESKDAGALKSALKLFLEECGVYGENDDDEEDDEE
jgi:hypothetical protein